MKLLIKKGRVVDPENHLDETRDILIENGKISQVGKEISNHSAKIIDASGKIVMPGLVDMHVHLREPGREDKETVASATVAALKGGVTSLLAMPNTLPAMDTPEHVKMLKKIIRETAHCCVFMSGAITKERGGKELAEINKFKKEGVLAISDDGASVDNEGLMFKALERARLENLAVVCHCEDKLLSANGVVNLGLTSTKLGLRGISNASEYQRVERDIQLAEKAKSALHIAHVSCKESVELIARAKKKGIKVTAETAPHYFALSEEEVWGYDTNKKTNPPLRSKEDVAAIKTGLRQGIIDVIASDHAPHTENEKDIEFERAEFGVVGLETILAVAITELIHPGILDWSDLVRRLALNPAKILGIDKGRLGVGADADLIVVAADKEWTVEKQQLVSKSKNSAFLGRTLKGIVEYTVLAGDIVYKS